MNKISFYTAAATHGHYGPGLLVVAVGATRELAVRNVITKMIERCQDYDKKLLLAQTETIVEHMKKHDGLNDGESENPEGFEDDYICVTVEQNFATINTTIAL